MGKGTFSHWSRIFCCWRRTFFSSWTFSVRVGLFCVRVGLFSIGGGLFSIGGGLFPSPPVTEKSPPPTRKSPTAIPKRCWTLEYSGELEFSSPFMEQWTLDARGVLLLKTATHIFSFPTGFQRIVQDLSLKVFIFCGKKMMINDK